jgi:cytochrome c oxidase subunit 2
VGLRLPERTGAARRVRRPAALAGVVALVLVLAGCSKENAAGRFGMPDVVTTQGEKNLELWQGAWIAALLTGLLVWGLILWAVVFYRRRSEDEIPVQTRYNLPIEIFYTIFPIVMVVVFFSHTVRVQNVALELDDNPDLVVTVVGQKWQWTFNQPGPGGEDNVFVSGTGEDIPTLVLPVDQTIQFDLHSPDVVHDFGIPAFAMRMDIIPGQEVPNAYQVHTTDTGEFKGKCYELCGTYHSRMLFDVEVVSQEDYEAYIEELASDPDHLTEEPVLGDPYSDEAIQGEFENKGGSE